MVERQPDVVLQVALRNFVIIEIIPPSDMKMFPFSCSLGEFSQGNQSGGGGTTRPLPKDGGAEELRGDPTVGPHPKVWTIDRE